MSNYRTNAREAVVAWLQDDEALAAHVKKWFLFDSGDRQPLDVMGIECPALEVGPANTTPTPATNRSDDVRFALAFRLHVKGLRAALAEEFLALVESALARGLDARFDLTDANGLYNAQAGQVAFHRQIDGGDDENALLQQIGWRVEFLYTLTLRRTLTAANP